ncbi:DNA-3-methyladenine glycosylase family protein [Cohnella luojiensis]|uniref:DNA-3-methyladenine glycosylase II n=1 Tax=Cohnella luojiensis TaxID=652876 RepID=A0A4Y8LU20_9BACL|nr:DNA-3-methyladenine glycosylase 2 [Cohnella luojiensis]TFE19647.1 DNA-3-methyladenine glycosylase 2 [Cohnella luojiensis]
MNPLIKISVPTEFNFQVNLDYLSRSPDESLYRILGGKLYKTIPVGSQTPLFEVSGDESGFLTVRSMDGETPWSVEVVDAIVMYVREWFDLDNDLTPFYSMSQGDALLNGVVNRLYGLRNMGIPDLFEALCWGIIGQQINLAFAYTLKRRFVESFGKKVSNGEVTCWLFPAPEDIAALSVSDIAALKMTTKKSEYLIGVARLLADGVISKEMLMEAESFKAAEKMLVSIRGIGPWTANYVLMRCLRYPAAFPIDDVGLHNAIKSVLEMEQKPTVAQIRELSAGWANWEAYATFYLWRVLY